MGLTATYLEVYQFGKANRVYWSQGVETIGAVHGKDVYFLPLVARRRVLAPTSERSTVLGFALRGIKHTSFPDKADQ